MGPLNPDSRVLPPGWNQHYDASRSTWYYIYTNVSPPRVTTTHPLGPLPDTAPSPLTPPTSEIDRPSDGPAFPGSPEYKLDPPSPRPSTVQPKASQLSFAQQLYASAAKPSQTYASPSTTPTIPTPPLSPPPSSTQRTRSFLPNPSLPSSNGNAANHYNSSDFHNPAVSSQHPSQHETSHSVHSHPSHHSSSSHYAPHRTQSHPPLQMFDQRSSTYRSSTYSAGMMSKPKATPNLTTTLRPPPHSKFRKKPDTTPALQIVAAPPLNANMTIPAPTPSYPTPPNSTSLASALNASTYSLYPTPTSLPQSVQQSYALKNQAAAASPRPQQQQQQTTLTPGQTLGKITGPGTTGGALLATLGIQQGTSGSISGAIGGALVNGVLSGDGDSMSSLANGLLNLGIQNTGVNTTQLQAAMQGQPGADYQSLINTLGQQQATRPAQGVDYQSLITRLQQTQSAQQQQMQAQMASLSPGAGQNTVLNPALAAYTNAYNAQLQFNQQQHQPALNAQAQPTVAAAQEASQAQQMQALLQAYQQQQQLQLQLRHQQQAVQQQQTLQQQLLLQQAQAAQPTQFQQAPQASLETQLGSFLTGYGQALSSFDDSGNNVETGASDGGGSLLFFGDLPSES